MAATPIFISYRRDDTAGYARALCDALAARFGADRVFMDVDDIAAGQPFAEVLRRAVDGSSVLLVLIGPRWRGERTGQGARIDEPGDFVRLEVAAALAGGGRVIPLLVDGTAMPATAGLPAEMRPLAGLNALQLGNAHFATDVDRLVAALRDDLPAPAAPPRRRFVAAGLAIAAMGAIGGGAVLWAKLGPRAAPPAVTAPARAAIDGEWIARVRYDWSNADHTERFSFAGSADALQGRASFLGVSRGLLEGSVTANGLRFVTRTTELPGPVELVHRYRAQLDGAELRFVMQTEGGSSAHGPVEFVARRVPTPAGVRSIPSAPNP
jgi:hypothetical protein